MPESLYDLLEVAEDASPLAIKSAYRRLAKRFHPDSGAPADVERFQRIQQAYQTLSDPDRRRAYDRSRLSANRAGAHPVSWTGGFVEPLVPMREAGLGLAEVFAQTAPRLEIVMSPEEASRGARLVVEVPRVEPCRSCGQTGRDFFGWCRRCHGEGWMRGMEAVTLTVPRGVQSGEVLHLELGSGRELTARVLITLPDRFE